MSGLRAKFLFPPLLGVMAWAQGVPLPEVASRTLGNGVKVLLLERPGAGAVQARVFLRGGRANTGGLPPAAADLLARTLFTRLLPEALDQSLSGPLQAEDGAFAALRLDRLHTLRAGTGLPSSEFPDLKALHAKALATLVEKLGALEVWDGLDALGATHRDLTVTADFLSHGADLPVKAFLPWCQWEAGRLKHLPLARFPLERDRLLREIEGGTPPSSPSLSVLLATALSGHPYAQAADFQRSGVEAISLEDLQGYGEWMVRPEHLTLVLVGDVKLAAVLPALERSFGTLGKGVPRSHWNPMIAYQSEDPMGSLESPGGRHLLVSTTGDTRLYFAWRMPPVNHPDGPALQVLAQIMGGAPSSRLRQNLTGPRGVARRLTLKLGVPGEREANLLVVEAEPESGRSMEELELAVQGEALRLQREVLPEQEVRTAQTQLEADQILLQEDAAILAQTLGAAQCQGGDWRLAFRALELGRTFKPAEIQSVARTYLTPARVTVALLAPDPLLLSMDRTEGRLLQVLTALVQLKLKDPAQVQVVLREALRQMRMLSSGEREKTLKLLEAQVRP